MKFGQKGIGSATVLIVLAAVAFGTIGPPVVAEAVGVQPDSPFYSLQRAGEAIREPFADDLDWNLSLAERRQDEFRHMVEKGKEDQYMFLIEEANSHLTKAVTLSDDTEELNLTLQDFREYALKLENVKATVPSEVEVEIEELQIRSLGAISEAENIILEKEITEMEKTELKTRLQEIKVETRKLVKGREQGLEFELIGNPDEVTLRTDDTSLVLQIGEIQENPRIEQIENLVLEIEKVSPENYYAEIGPAENISLVGLEDNFRFELGMENIKVKFHQENYRIVQPENIEVTVTLEYVSKRGENRRFKDLVVEGDGVQGNVISQEKPKLALQAEGENVTILSAETKWYASVVIAADEEYRAENPDWKEKTEDILEDADDHFIREYGLNFRTVRFEGYNSDDSLNDPIELFWDTLEKMDKGNANLMLAFCGQYEGGIMGGIMGLAEFRGDDAMIFPESIGWPCNESEVTQHELSHLYNARDHIPGLTDVCIMSYTWGCSTRRWCGTCHQRITEYIQERAPLEIWTDEKSYSPGETVWVNLKNLSDRPIVVGEISVSRIFSILNPQTYGKFWPIYNSEDRIAPGEVYRVELKPKSPLKMIISIPSSGGGENLEIKLENTIDLKEIWDQDPPDPGEYWLTWKPYDPERNETFGRTSCTFSVTGSLLHVKPSEPRWVRIGENLRFTAQLVAYHENGNFGIGVPSTRDVTESVLWSISTPSVGSLEKRTVDDRVYEVFQAENVGETILEASYDEHSDNSSVIKVSPKVAPPGKNIVVGELDLEAVSDEYLIAKLYENENRALKGVPGNVDGTGFPPDLPPDPHGVDVTGSVDGVVWLGWVPVYYEGSKNIERGDQLTGYGALHLEERYIDAFSDNYWAEKEKEPEVTSIVVRPSQVRLNVGGFENFYAIATYSNGENKYVTGNAEWTVEPSNIGRINILHTLCIDPSTCTVIFIAENVGSATIRANYKGYSGAAEIAVENIHIEPIENVVISVENSKTFRDSLIIENVLTSLG